MRYIIGNGIAGLVAAYYKKDYFIIGDSKKIGGQFSSEKQLGPRFIKRNSKLELLLKKLNIEYKISNIYIKYLYENKFICELNNELINEYNSKVRNSYNASGSINNLKNSEEILIFNLNELLKSLTVILFKEKRYIDDIVSKIDYRKKFLLLKNSKKKLKYDKLISTINYIDFCKLVDIPCSVKCNNIYFYYISGIHLFYDYDILYIINKNYSINRISNTQDGIVIESPVRIPHFTEEVILKNAKISDGSKLRKFKNIKYFGRYAEMNNEIRVDTLFDKIGELDDE